VGPPDLETRIAIEGPNSRTSALRRARTVILRLRASPMPDSHNRRPAG
jgi:hypothetical protein